MRYMVRILISTVLLLIYHSIYGQLKGDYSDIFMEHLYQSRSPIKSFDAKTLSYDDLEPIGKAIGDRKIVLLGEPSHGDGGAIQMKTRLVKYLHEKKGFDVLLFEDDMCSILFDLSEINDTALVRIKAQENIMSSLSKSAVSKDFWNYYNQQLSNGSKIHLGGIHPWHCGKFAKTRLLNLLTEELSKLNYNTSSKSYQRLLKDINYTFQYLWESKKDSVDTNNYFKEIGKIEEVFKYHTQPIEKRNLWLLEIANLKNCFEFLVNGKNRDIYYAQNLALIAKYIYPDKKIIVWSHNNHNAMDVNVLASFDADFAKWWHIENTYATFTYFGADAFREFGNNVYSLAITSGSGNFSQNFMENGYQVHDFKSAKVIKSSENSLEYYLANKKCDVVFIPFPSVQGRPSGYPWFTSRLLDLSFEAKMDYISAFSGIIYINEVV
ncbi:hypothetical protein CHU92_00360 [Flavobacterium cyanobacteriorum]|uniref:Erythromycin esterase n=2 Tax=Flavobacterium cyanobacteriorum TaxID=2022802 RepID=A0A256A7W7_9FLAO|nr:hypothetical protein CHU92_00360 [Flavobacterium cyanobacteriorum]